MNEFIVTLNKKQTNVKILSDTELSVDKVSHNYELTKVTDHSFLLKLEEKVSELSAEKINHDSFKILFNSQHYEVFVRTLMKEKALKMLETSSSDKHQYHDIKSPMPGLILKIIKNIDDKVEQGESIMILEAMKMENDIKSPKAGSIEKVFVKEGDAVEKGMILFSIR